jgi:hypothetical protein
MFCPTCGGETSETMKFCRSCGMELQPVAEIIAGRHSAVAQQLARPDSGRTPKRWEESVKGVGNVLTVASLVGFCVLLVGMIPLGLAHPAYTDSLVLWFLEGDLLLLLGGLGLKSLQRLLGRRPVEINAAATSQLPEGRTGALPPGAPPSVTERTTKSLRARVRESARPAKTE